MEAGFGTVAVMSSGWYFAGALVLWILVLSGAVCLFVGLFMTKQAHAAESKLKELSGEGDNEEKHRLSALCRKRDSAGAAFGVTGVVSLLCALAVGFVLVLVHFHSPRGISWYERAIESTDDAEFLEEFEGHWEQFANTIGSAEGLLDLRDIDRSHCQRQPEVAGELFRMWLREIEHYAPDGYNLRRMLEETPLEVFRVKPKYDTHWYWPFSRRPFALEESDHPAHHLSQALYKGDPAAVHAVFDRYLYSKAWSPLGEHHIAVGQLAAGAVLESDLTCVSFSESPLFETHSLED